MGIFLGCRTLGIAQQPAKQVQAKAARRADGGERVSEIVNPAIVEFSRLADSGPCLLQVDQVLAFPRARQYPIVLVDVVRQDPDQHFAGRRR